MEADLAGYWLYRSEIEGEIGVQINQDLLTENSYIDMDVETGVYYYYTLKAVDETDNESEPSEQVRSRIITMDQGVLIVADTPNGNGSFQNPTLASVTDFYNQILTGYYPDIYPLWSEERVKLADLGAYSTIVWHKNNVAVSTYDDEMINVIKQFLDLGGNILFSTYFPGKLLGNSNVYPSNFNQGSFIYDYLKIDQANMISSARFKSANPTVSNYPEMIVDEDKAPAGLNYHIFNVESIAPSNQGTMIYSYQSDFPDGSPESSMNGLPVGIEYMGNDYKVITLSFPLYYIDQQDARDFISYVMNEKFFEPVNVEDDVVIPITDKEFNLYSNYPNPFNPETVIKFSLQRESVVTVAVYNLKGQRVRVLIDDKVGVGEHLAVWNGKDDHNREVASGIYFYQLTTEFGQDIKKMLLMK